MIRNLSYYVLFVAINNSHSCEKNVGDKQEDAADNSNDGLAVKESLNVQNTSVREILLAIYGNNNNFNF